MDRMSADGSIERILGCEFSAHMMEFKADIALVREMLMVSGYKSSVMQWN